MQDKQSVHYLMRWLNLHIDTVVEVSDGKQNDGTANVENKSNNKQGIIGQAVNTCKCPCIKTGFTI